MTVLYPVSTEAAAPAQSAASAPRRRAFFVIALFILLGPAPGQLFGWHSMLLREWIMFSAAGVGLPKGQFTLHRSGGAVTLTPLEVVGMPSYVALPLDQRLYEPSDFKRFAARICNDPHETARLSFEGSIGTMTGWQAMNIDDVCHGEAKP